MNFARPIAFAVLFALAAPAASAALPSIEDPAHDPRWSDLFAALAADTSRIAVFEERRHFPFRKKPVVLRGELRLAPGRGLSLQYLAPDPQTLIGDEQGLVVRDARGRTRHPPNDDRTRAAAAVLVDVLDFDLAALHEEFAFQGERTGDDWILQLVPRDASLDRSLGAITLTGQHDTIERIELTRAANQRVEILIRDARDNVEFSGADLKRYFR